MKKLFFQLSLSKFQNQALSSIHSNRYKNGTELFYFEWVLHAYANVKIRSFERYMCPRICSVVLRQIQLTFLFSNSGMSFLSFPYLCFFFLVHNGYIFGVANSEIHSFLSQGVMMISRKGTRKWNCKEKALSNTSFKQCSAV